MLCEPYFIIYGVRVKCGHNSYVANKNPEWTTTEMAVLSNSIGIGSIQMRNQKTFWFGKFKI